MIRFKFLVCAMAMLAMVISGCENKDQILGSGDQEAEVTELAKENNVDSGVTAGETLYGMTTSNKLLRFDSANPRSILSRMRVTGLQPDEELLGIDFRPATGQLYGLGSSSRLYVINLQTAAATPVGPGPFSPALEGNAFGFDFNPTVDRIRVVGETGQNLRLHPDLGTVVDSDPVTAGIQPDGRLAYAAADVNFNRRPSAVGAAYTNPDNDPATGTTLYDLDARRDVLAIQNPPNNGVLNTVGRLRSDIEKLVGFDISRSGVAYATVKRDGDDDDDDDRDDKSPNGVSKIMSTNGGKGYSKLVTVDLTTGRITRIGTIGTSEPIRGLAVSLQ
ncbi:MAG: DUF4394 domain-containing protein [bacterium]